MIMTANTSKPRKVANSAPVEVPVVEILKLKRRDKVEQERVPVFAMEDENGVEQVYTMPAKISRGSALKLMRVLTREPEVIAVSIMLEEILGKDGLDALEAADLPDEDFDAIVEKIQTLVFGASEEGKGN
jgi:hypothetical protein